MRLLYAQQSWDQLELQGVHRNGVDFLRTPTTMRLAGMRVVEEIETEHHLIELGTNWDDYVQSRVPMLRAQLFEFQHLKQRDNPWEFRRFRSPSFHFANVLPHPAMFDRSEESDGWKSDEIDAEAIQSIAQLMPEEGTFDVATLQAAAEEGCLDVGVMYQQGVIVAAAVSVRSEGRLTGMTILAGQRYDRPHLIRLLMANVIRDSFHRGDSSIYFARPSTWTGQWCNHNEASYRYTYVPANRVRARVCRVLDRRLERVRG